MYFLTVLFWSISCVLLPVSSALHITTKTIDKFLLPNYDFIIIGGGTSGLVVANRLSEDVNTTVLVIESGEVDNREAKVVSPGYIGLTPPSPYGKTTVTTPQIFLDDHVLQGLVEIGIPIVSGLNEGDSTGAMIVPSSMSPTNQTRSDARTGYFDPAIPRANLHVVTGHTVTRLILGLPGSRTKQQGRRRIIAVEFSSGPHGIQRTVTTKREVILAAGAIQSPILLQVSGIGPEQVLESLNISVQIDLPGVGNNFQDHPMAQFPFEYSNSSIFTSRDLAGDAFNDALDTFLLNQTGPLTVPLINTVAFLTLQNHTSEGQTLLRHAANQSFDFLPLDTPPSVVTGYRLQKHLLLSHLARPDVGAYELLAASWGQLSIAAQKPLSRGTVRPSTISVFDPPLVDPRYCADPFDCKILRLGLQLAGHLAQTAAMAPLQPVVDPRFNTSDERELMAALKPLVGTEFHPSGTTAMMPKDLGGVVDDKLMVYGTCNLRVVDAGIMPMTPGAHIQAAVYAVAEKVWRLIG
ncbi:Pyranose dehydrogenase 1-like protein 1 [Colletotrichum chlorophyti]|uniref:Pyranose dehydrogenase 1-like protein 1 n=1 Tax=Colletotrichum chlorophyti TaxID=708187 RepID=A0A1Q8RU31_9PEZI|nr:Pyranose dehydrogenase 1-like protein 1 [Colletotrichum chlorophyti]